MSHIKANRIKYLKETQPSHPRNITFTKTVNVSSNSYKQFSLELSSFKYKHLKKIIPYFYTYQRAYIQPPATDERKHTNFYHH